VENIRRRDSTKLAFKTLKILRLPEIYLFSVLIFVYKYKNGLLPSPFNSFYTTNSQIHNYPTRHANHLRMPTAKTKMASSFVKKTGANIWSNLPNHIHHNMKIGGLKKLVIEHLIANYII
jgi:hypothetical protein